MSLLTNNAILLTSQNTMIPVARALPKKAPAERKPLGLRRRGRQMRSYRSHNSGGGQVTARAQHGRSLIGDFT